MTFGGTDPLNARDRFKTRSLETMALVAALFIALTVMMSATVSHSLNGGLFPMLVGDVFLIALCYYFYTVWKMRPVRLRCAACTRILLSNTPWICGFCGHANRNANQNPFVHDCAGCHDQPKAYKCHHSDCNKLIFLSEDLDPQNYAYRIHDPQEPWGEAKSADRRATREEREFEIQMTELELRLKAMKEKLESPKMKTPMERKIQAFEEEFAAGMGVRAHIEEMEAKARETYKDSPKKRKEVLDFLKELKEKHSI